MRLARGDRGQPVIDIQTRLGSLGYGVDPSEHGLFGDSTEQAVRAFQQGRELPVDGAVDEHTWGELVEAGYSLGDRALYLRYPYLRGDDVRSLQRGLNLLGFDAGKEDGIFGERADRAVREFQRNVGLPSDGIVGATTLQALNRLRPVSQGPGRAMVREREALERLSATIHGARIALDPGHGPGDPGSVGPTGLTEAEAAMSIAVALAAELRRRGANPLLLRAPDTNPSPSERARQANSLGAEAVVSLHLHAHGDGRAEGASTYYYGREGWFSPAGRRLADLIQERLTARLGLKDGRTHPRSLPLLRETNMPAVHVEPCFISNPDEERLLRLPAFHEDLAAAAADAIERFFGRSNRTASASVASGRAGGGHAEGEPERES